MDEMCSFFTSAGLSIVPSATNFILIGFDGHNGPTAHETARYLASKNILFREMAPYGLDQYLRMSIGTDEEMEIVKQTLSDFFASSQKADY
jgi:histidinol-phosphate aminotransferase